MNTKVQKIVQPRAINSLKFSLFYDAEKGIHNVTPLKTIGLEELFSIYNADGVKQLTNELRAALPKDRPRIKLKLPFFTPYGVFTKRNNSMLQYFNQELVALDFDGLDRPNAEKLKRKLTLQPCTVLAVISPRMNGVKALILLKCNKTPLSNFNDLKLNAESICGRMGIYEYKEYCDRAQFVLCQPMFIAHDPGAYMNPDAKAIDFNFKTYEPPQVQQYNRGEINTSQTTNNRIDSYLLSATNKLYNELISTPKGQRHHSIIKVQKIASWLHYAPHLENEIKNSLLRACIAMYGGAAIAQLNNVQKSFAGAWNGAQNAPNPTIEIIINELNLITV
jgi:hypothetical protein